MMNSHKSFTNIGKNYNTSLSIRVEKQNSDKGNRSETSYGLYSKTMLYKLDKNKHISSNKILRYIESKCDDISLKKIEIKKN